MKEEGRISREDKRELQVQNAEAGIGEPKAGHLMRDA
jgi:hypothetical protein